ncbi:efflux RND transporter permease subunit [Legionella resiliens]|uniref:Efflux RND transporter permease subunit n=1 Tax=Legionella resiliens TaxID=2905958 RepID=A0ABS8XAV6_9GAMM|nr:MULTISPECIES: efflux RND transporter permease subunit [unclassified Legionella]MCE0724799.1 efflux RND transporter permease subunit [Legionella sp. 9fVS26]MCE3533953.1 efflux RND transporter permease subunit [Legionella sp. 8cVS16]
MKFTSYFLKHPVIAIILNSMILLLGILCFHSLSLREYPDISFPVITVNTHYPNASPELVESVVTNVLEDQLAGVEGLELMTSRSNPGKSHITLRFRPGTSMDKALNATHEAARLAQLPTTVEAPLIERQRQADGLPFIGIALESSSLNFGELTHYANLNLKNVFRSLKGVASVDVWGQPFTYSIQLDQKKLYAFGINVDEVANAIANNRLSLPAGNYQNKIPTTLDFELKTPEDYENLIIKTHNHYPVFLKSLAQIQLTTDNNQFRVKVNGHSGLVLAINRANDANPIEVSQSVRKELNALKKGLPDDIKTKIIIDQSEFIKASLKNIQSSILESIFLVLVIIFIFLRNIRATIIPLIAIPISLLGSLLFLKIAGFTINQMTLLAMVLAVGLVVDDAIIVLENIWRHIEDDLSPMDAALKGSKQIGFAIVAMTLTLTSVYAPIALIDGMIGQLFIEFAVALAGSVFISGVVALTLSPLMCATFLHKNTKHLWPAIDRFLSKLTQYYYKLLSIIIYRKKTTLLLLILSLSLSLLFYKVMPGETAPKEDRGLVGIYTPPLSGDNLDTLEANTKRVQQSIGKVPEAKNTLTFLGNWGSSIVMPLEAHKQRNRSAEQIVNSLKPKTEQLPSVDASVWSWDSGLPGVEDARNNSELELVISTTENFRQLFDATEHFKKILDQSKEFASTHYDLRLDSMGYSINIDKNALAQLGLTPAQLAKTIEVFFSGDKSMSFQKDGVSYNLTLEGSSKPWTLNELYLTTPSGKRISLGAVAQMKRRAQPTALEHVNQMRSTTLYAQLPEKQSFKKGMNRLLKLAKENFPNQYKLSWAGAAKAYTESSYTMVLLFTLSILFIYAILAAQFENFVYPFIILFTVPLACFGALLFAYLFGQSLNIFTQIGLVTLVGLISKHGILIVEFANQLQKEGFTLAEAIKKSCSLRLRPILMTTGAMVFGAIPLVLSHDAGAEARHAIGTVLIGGLCIGTLFTLFVLPAVYFMISKIINRTGKA